MEGWQVSGGYLDEQRGVSPSPAKQTRVDWCAMQQTLVMCTEKRVSEERVRSEDISCCHARAHYRGTSLIRNSTPPLDHHRALGIVLLQGARGALFLMSEVPLYYQKHRAAQLCGRHAEQTHHADTPSKPTTISYHLEICRALTCSPCVRSGEVGGCADGNQPGQVPGYRPSLLTPHAFPGVCSSLT